MEKWEATEDITYARGWYKGEMKFVESLAAKNIAKPID